MKRSFQEIIELLAFGLIALLIFTGVIWILGAFLGLLGALFMIIAGFLWAVLRWIIPAAIIVAAVYFLVKLAQNQNRRDAATRGTAAPTPAKPVVMKDTTSPVTPATDVTSKPTTPPVVIGEKPIDVSPLRNDPVPPHANTTPVTPIVTETLGTDVGITDRGTTDRSTTDTGTTDMGTTDMGTSNKDKPDNL